MATPLDTTPLGARPIEATPLEVRSVAVAPQPGLARRSSLELALDVAACKAILRKGSKSFAMASLLLPARLRDRAAVFYAFCRVADDAVDDSADPAAAVISLRARLDAVYGGRPIDDPVDRALSALVLDQAIPRDPFDALLEGFVWDARGRWYESYSDVLAYAARVASAVGVVMTYIMGARDAPTLARACDLGAAMQLTNIARDVGEDAARGRLYLPAQWLREEGVHPDAWLARPRFEPGIGRVVQRLLGEADVLYERSKAGIPALPPDCRASIRAAGLIYRDIGRVIAARGFDSVSGRATVGTWRKVGLALRARFARRLESTAQADAPPLGEFAFLLPGAPR